MGMFGGQRSELIDAVDPNARKLAELALEQEKMYQEKFVPLEDAWLSKIKKTQSSRDASSGMYSADIIQRSNQGIREGQQQLFAGGINPNSGAYASRSAQTYGNLGTGISMGLQRGATEADNGYYKKAVTASGLGVDYGSSGLNTLGSGYGSLLATKAFAENSSNMADAYKQASEGIKYGTLGTVAGSLAMGAAGYMKDNGLTLNDLVSDNMLSRYLKGEGMFGKAGSFSNIG